MGICMSNPQGTPEERAKNREIDREMQKVKEREENTVRILLLGAGDSGKSTVVKQMRIISNTPFKPSELESYRENAFANILDGIRMLLRAMRLELKIEVSDSSIAHLPIVMTGVNDVKEGDPFPEQLLEPLKALWADPAVRAAYARGNEFALPDNLEYFFSDLDRLWEPNYMPTNADILHTRVRTIGMTETVFKSTKKAANDKLRDLHFIDVGGQKSERRKWINFFQDVRSILFLASLSGYDECLVEDRDANQMQDAMQIWDGICNSQWFKKSALILFLNKMDLFERKLANSHIRADFPDYDGPDNDLEAGRKYFKRRFVRIAAKSDRHDVYTHFTTATNTNSLKVVMMAVEVSSFGVIYMKQ